MASSQANKVLPSREPNTAPTRSSFGRELAGWVIPIYLALILAGFLILKLPSATVTGSEIPVPRALTTSVNAVTNTGFPLAAVSIDKLKPIGQAVIFCLTVCGSLLSLTLGGMAAARILRLPYSDLRIILFAVGVETAAIVLGTIALFDEGNRGTFDAAFQAACAFGNCGLHSGSVPNVTSPLTHLVLMPWAILGGLGLPVLMELFDWVSGRRKLSKHSLTALGMTAWVYLAGVVLLAALFFATATWSDSSDESAAALNAAKARQGVASASVMAIDSRTAGLPVVSVADLSRSAMWLVIVLMIIGASPAGTGGGIKTTTLVELYRGVRRALRGEPVGRPFGIAGVWVAGYAAVVLVVMLVLVGVEPSITPERVVFLTVSAASNVGLSPDDVQMTPAGLYLLSLAMFAGRVMPILMLWWMAETTKEAELLVA